ncbi:hypothetical protein BJ917_2032 [Pseudomonas sp. WPR_5_2]|nr:hypothetical protein BJ917_2032 [Pseudomonas sp. WPR_5_2]
MLIGPSSGPLMCLRSKKADIRFHVFEKNFLPMSQAFARKDMAKANKRGAERLPTQP